MNKVDMRSKSDCYLACIASLTGLAVEEMPQPPTSFEQLTQSGEPTQEDYEAEIQYENVLRSHLLHNGWYAVRLYGFVPRGYSIACGPSPRNSKISHCAVYKDGCLYHDPHPSRAGISSELDYEVLIPEAKPPGIAE